MHSILTPSRYNAEELRRPYGNLCREHVAINGKQQLYRGKHRGHGDFRDLDSLKKSKADAEARLQKIGNDHNKTI